MPIGESVDLTQWWTQFHDAELESLITRALAQNPDQLTAESRVREAREQEVIAGAKGLPQVNAIGNTVHFHSNSSPLAQFSSGSGSGGGTGGAPSGSSSTDIKLYSAGFDATWEIDIFGQVRRSVEAAEAGTEAARWQMHDGEVTLTAEIAADYVSLRGRSGATGYSGRAGQKPAATRWILSSRGPGPALSRNWMSTSSGNCWHPPRHNGRRLWPTRWRCGTLSRC